MQNYTTILGIIDMRQRGISYDDCRSRYHIGCSTITLIMERFIECGKNLDTLKRMLADDVEHLFFPPENLRRKDDSVMPDYQLVYDRLAAPRSKANLFLPLAEIQKGMSFRISIYTALPVFQTLCWKELWFRCSQHGGRTDSLRKSLYWLDRWSAWNSYRFRYRWEQKSTLFRYNSWCQQSCLCGSIWKWKDSKLYCRNSPCN